MRSTSFNRDSVIKLENYLGSYNKLSAMMRDGYQPSNKVIRNLIEKTCAQYEHLWGSERNEIVLEIKSPLSRIMAKHKDGDGQIPDHALPEALDTLANIVSTRRTMSLSNYDESGFDKIIRNSPKVLTSAISNAPKLVKYPLMVGVCGIAAGLTLGAIATEGTSRASLLLVSFLAYGALNIAEKLESSNLSRRVLRSNFEFEIQGAKKSIGNFISNISESPFFHTSNAVDAVAIYLSGDAKQEKTPQQETKTLATGRSRSLGGDDSSYYNAHASGDPKKIKKANEDRFIKHLQETQDRQYSLQGQRASSLPSQHFGSARQDPRSRNGEGRTSSGRPGPAPRRPLRATPARSMVTGPGAPPRRY